MSLYDPDPQAHEPFYPDWACGDCRDAGCPGCQPHAFGADACLEYELRQVGIEASVVCTDDAARSLRVQCPDPIAATRVWAHLGPRTLHLASDGPCALRVAPMGAFIWTGGPLHAITVAACEPDATAA